MYMPVNVCQEHWILLEIDMTQMPRIAMTYFDPLTNYRDHADEVFGYIQIFIGDVAQFKRKILIKEVSGLALLF